MRPIPRYGFLCLDCSKTFKDRVSAVRHVQRNHLLNAPSFFCRFCSKEYRVEKDRQQHMNRVHGLVLSAKEIRELDTQP